MTEDINRHLDDLIADINKVRKALVEHPSPSFDVQWRLCDISNALDDLYHDLIGI